MSKNLIRQALPKHRHIDPRIVRRLNWLLLAIILAGTVRLNRLVQTLPYGRADSVKTAETALSLFLAEADYPAHLLFSHFRNQVLNQLPPRACLTYRGKKIVIVDPTPYPKRSRKGKKNRQMQFISRVRVSLKDKQKETTCPGYLDIWAGLLLKGRQVLPLARKLSSSAHPKFVSQNLLEESVIWQALASVGWKAILIADRGFRRKALLVKLLLRQVDFVIRMAENIHVLYRGEWRNILEVARQVQVVGRVMWKEGKERAVPCQAAAFRAQLREDGDEQGEANPEVNLVVLFPLVGANEPLILATSLPVRTVKQVQEVVKLYEYRWAIETTFENLKRDFHLDEFMVREWVAIERLLWAVAMAYSLLVVLYVDTRREGRRFLEAVKRVLRRRAVVGKGLTIGKLREAIALDQIAHPQQWLAAFQEST